MDFSCDSVENPEITAKIDRAKGVTSLARPLVCLPNIHPKAGLESPPQFVAATKDSIVPMLSAPAMNCGMSLFKTNLTRSDFSEEFLINFAVRLRAGVHPWIGRSKTFLQWIGLYKRPATIYDLTEDELKDIFVNGAPAAAKRYRLTTSQVVNMEYNGCVLSEEEKGGVNFKNLIPRSSWVNGRHEMGYNFGGNHFLEIQYIEKILDPEKAREWGIIEDQIVLFYHGGGGHATYHLGRYFGRREKNTRLEKFILFWLKIPFHFGSWESIKNIRVRWRAYFSRTPFPETSLHSPEGKRLMQSIKIALNYGYAFRTALLRRIIDALPKPGADASFVWDAAHNSIMEEGIQGAHLIVHRQDAVRVFPDKPVMIAGFNTLSYLGVGQEETEISLHSATPSAGKTIAKYKEAGKSTEDQTRTVLISKRKEKELKSSYQQTPEGLFAVTGQLEAAGIVKPVAYLRPLGTIKGH